LKEGVFAETEQHNYQTEEQQFALEKLCAEVAASNHDNEKLYAEVAASNHDNNKQALLKRADEYDIHLQGLKAQLSAAVSSVRCDIQDDLEAAVAKAHEVSMADVGASRTEALHRWTKLESCLQQLQVEFNTSVAAQRSFESRYTEAHQELREKITTCQLSAAGLESLRQEVIQRWSEMESRLEQLQEGLATSALNRTFFESRFSEVQEELKERTQVCQQANTTRFESIQKDASQCWSEVESRFDSLESHISKVQEEMKRRIENCLQDRYTELAMLKRGRETEPCVDDADRVHGIEISEQVQRQVIQWFEENTRQMEAFQEKFRKEITQVNRRITGELRAEMMPLLKARQDSIVALDGQLWVTEQRLGQRIDDLEHAVRAAGQASRSPATLWMPTPSTNVKRNLSAVEHPDRTRTGDCKDTRSASHERLHRLRGTRLRQGNGLTAMDNEHCKIGEDLVRSEIFTCNQNLEGSHRAMRTSQSEGILTGAEVFKEHDMPLPSHSVSLRQKLTRSRSGALSVPRQVVNAFTHQFGMQGKMCRSLDVSEEHGNSPSGHNQSYEEHSSLYDVAGQSVEGRELYSAPICGQNLGAHVCANSEVDSRVNIVEEVGASGNNTHVKEHNNSRGVLSMARMAGEAFEEIGHSRRNEDHAGLMRGPGKSIQKYTECDTVDLHRSGMPTKVHRAEQPFENHICPEYRGFEDHASSARRVLVMAHLAGEAFEEHGSSLCSED